MYFHLAQFVFLAGTAAKASVVTETLKSVTALNHSKKMIPHIDHSPVVHLGYGIDGHSSLVDVALHVNHPTILLEHMDAVASLTYSDSSIAMVFFSQDTFEHSVQAWSELDDILLIVNLLSDNGTENERGFFLSDRIHRDDATLTLIVSGQRKNVSDIASRIEMNFFRAPATLEGVNKIHVSPFLNKSGSSGLPNNTALLSRDELSATATETYVSAEITFSGYIDYGFLLQDLREAYFDIDASFSANLGLALNVTVPFSYKFDYPIPGLSWGFLHISDMLEVGPTVEFKIGVDVGVDVPVSVETDISLEIHDGHIHLDLLHEDQSYAENWQPQHTSSVNISVQDAVMHVSPYLDFTTEFSLDFFGLDLGCGITAEPKFSNEFVVPTEEDNGGHGRSLSKEGLTCTNGSEFHSKLQFSIFAFATQFYNKELYHIEQPIEDGCLPL